MIIKLLLATEFPIISLGFEKLLSDTKDMKIVGKADGVSLILEKIKSTNPDVLIIDLEMVKINSLKLIKRIHKYHRRVKILALSSKPEAIYALSIIRAGASGFMSKSTAPKIVPNILKKVHNNEIYISAALAKFLTFNEEGELNTNTKMLSNREMEVLQFIYQGLSNKSIAASMEINDKTVGTYKSRLMKKLGVTNTVSLIKRAESMGISSS
jgi:DNA-binding NarL/FixJ family response regulator